jgi:membrane-associated phospholipid phosphatase
LAPKLIILYKHQLAATNINSLQTNSISLLEQIAQYIISADQRLFLYINRVWANSFFDAVFPIYRESYTWIPFYFFLLILVLVNFGKKAWPWILFFIVTVSLCDQVSSNFIKDFFGRVRPCRDPEIAHYVRLLLSRCPSSGSFTSSHAVNHFGMVAFMVVTIGHYIGRWKTVLWVWASLIAYAQVYIGVHYPFDVIGGAMLGTIIGYVLGTIFNKKIGVLQLPHASSNNISTQRI